MMNSKHILFLFLGILSACAARVPLDSKGVDQWSNEHLVRIDGDKVYADEFLYVLSKNSSQAESAIEEAEFNQNFDLFLNYRLKVKYAQDLGLDQTEEFLTEFDTYKEEVKKPFLMESSLEEEEIKKVYSRMKEMVKASHILVQFPPEPKKEDSTAVYHLLEKIKVAAENGEDFGDLALRYSEDPSAESNRGSLGYFTAMQMVLPFEEAAYKLSPGEISEPVHTDFGVHLIKLEDRKANPGEVRVAHLLIRADKGDSVSSERAERKISEIYLELENDSSRWEDLVSTFSEDQGSKNNGGLIPWFGVGAIVPEFEKAAFSLDKVAEYSPPVKTDYGYHIIRLEEVKPFPAFEEVENTIKSKVLKDARSKLIKSQVVELQKEKYGFIENEAIGTRLLNELEGIKAQSFEKLKPQLVNLDTNETLAISNIDTIIVADFIFFLEKNFKENQTTNFKNQYERFLEEKLSLWEEDELLRNNEDYRQLIREYRNGILIFNLMNEMVWEQALKDSLGQMAYFQQNMEKYQWPERIEALVLDLKKEKKLKEVKNFLEAIHYGDGIVESLEREFLADDPLLFKVENKTFEIDGHAFLGDLNHEEAVHEIRKDGIIYLVRLGEKIPSGPKRLDETRGKLIQDYQNHLDNELIKALKEKYNIQINEDEKERIYHTINE
jgi:peptidyl-prolyl cis-trans isomerase SurA